MEKVIPTQKQKKIDFEPEFPYVGEPPARRTPFPPAAGRRPQSKTPLKIMRAADAVSRLCSNQTTQLFALSGVAACRGREPGYVCH